MIGGGGGACEKKMASKGGPAQKNEGKGGLGQNKTRVEKVFN